MQQSFNVNGMVLMYSIHSNNAKLKFPNTLIAIKKAAFAGCKKMKNSYVPPSVVMIGNSA